MAQKDVAAVTEPFPLYLMIDRLSYFPLVFDRLKAHFLGTAPATLDEMWLEYNGEPLKWHFTVGTLFDMFCVGGGATVPWNVTVHVSSFPEEELLRLSGLQAVKSNFMSSLKEANYLKHGDGSKVMGLSRVDQDNLWHTIGSDETGFDKFWEVNGQLLGEKATLKSCAIRIVQRGGGPVKQLPFPPIKEDGTDATLGDALNAHGISEDRKILIQGVEVPRDAPLFGIQATLATCDGWVYVSVSKN